LEKFSLTQEVLLKLLSASINGTKAKIEEDKLKQTDWKAIGLLSSRQAVSLAVFDAVTPYKKQIDSYIYDNWYAHVLKGFSKNSVIVAAQKQLNDEICEGENYAVIKGISAAKYYLKPELRNLGDVDFLIDTGKSDDISQKILEKGYERHSENDCHICFVKRPAALEMHFEIPGIPYGEKGDIVRAYMSDTLEKAQMVAVMGNEFKMPCPHHHGAILLLHMQHHMVSEGLGLRHLCDWACFVRATMDDDFWDEKLLPLFKSIGLYKYACVMTKLCSLYLEIPCPAWAKDADESLCYNIMKDILEGGNFGRIDSKRQTSGMMISEHGKGGLKKSKIYNLARALHNSMYTIYPILKKAPILYPFLYVWRILVYIFKVITGKRNSLIKTMGLADERRSLYDQLEIFETK